MQNRFIQPIQYEPYQEILYNKVQHIEDSRLETVVEKSSPGLMVSSCVIGELSILDQGNPCYFGCFDPQNGIMHIGLKANGSFPKPMLLPNFICAPCDVTRHLRFMKVQRK